MYRKKSKNLGKIWSYLKENQIFWKIKGFSREVVDQLLYKIFVE